jgi:exopolyphosphatase/guanosine-5'-triphosphate,3'-diphosphate pyrophosphatase
MHSFIGMFFIVYNQWGEMMTIVGAIDIGTNSTRLLVAEISEAGKIRVLRSDMRTTRLGENIRERVLLWPAMERTLEVLKKFIRDAVDLNVACVILAATSAVRDAANKEEFISLIKRETGHEINILSGAEEARLSYLGVVSGLDNNYEQVTVIDVGGGSTEFTWSAPKGLVFKSFNVGAVRMTESNDSYEQIYDNLSNQIKLAGQSLMPEETASLPTALVGVGGTVTTMAAIRLGLRVYNPELVHGSKLNIGDVSAILNLLIGCDLEDRKQIYGLQPERADIIIAGVRIVHCAMTILKQAVITVSESDILHGLALAAANIVEIKL